MSTMNLDKPLDEIIATKKKSRSSKPRAAPRAPRAAAAPAQQQGGARGPRAQQHAAAAAHSNAGASASAGIQGIGDKIVISNLPLDVNEQQVRELFTSTVGPIISASMAYDAHGRSKGTATIHFRKAADATKAFQQYNKRLIDNSGNEHRATGSRPGRAPEVRPLLGPIDGLIRNERTPGQGRQRVCTRSAFASPKLAISKAPQSRRRRYKAKFTRSIAEGFSSTLSAEWSWLSASPSTHPGDPKARQVSRNEDSVRCCHSVEGVSEVEMLHVTPHSFLSRLDYRIDTRTLLVPRAPVDG
ncbi:BQ2448_6575 [Microbotryum intermedium]|uniref:BQ2448_6575 protein n=1 Tax=Microbotryum intermedium TaxID=269621 RepID=A0A238FQ64_9BASI|nr:BQ2448_6575 [Microbotryum intermedium]